MSQYRRAVIPGGTFFFTVVTHHRQRIFDSPENVFHLRTAFRKVLAVRPFEIQGIVVLPDHLHCIWRLPGSDADFSGRWREIKKAASRAIAPRASGRNEGPVWQRRFWEHAICNGSDWRLHMDYIHYNPVRHGLADRPADWQWSSFRQCAAKGLYEMDWGSNEPPGVANLCWE